MVRSPVNVLLDCGLTTEPCTPFTCSWWPSTKPLAVAIAIWLWRLSGMATGVALGVTTRIGTCNESKMIKYVKWYSIVFSGVSVLIVTYPLPHPVDSRPTHPPRPSVGRSPPPPSLHLHTHPGRHLSAVIIEEKKLRAPQLRQKIMV